MGAVLVETGIWNQHTRHNHLLLSSDFGTPAADIHTQPEVFAELV